MDSDRAASSQRWSAGAGRSDRSSSIQGVYVPTPEEERPGEVALKCHCGVYAIPYLSRTESNPNRLFFGCPFFKARLTHYKFFMWLDVYTARVVRATKLPPLPSGNSDKRGAPMYRFKKAQGHARLDYSNDTIINVCNGATIKMEERTSINVTFVHHHDNVVAAILPEPRRNSRSTSKSSGSKH
ncbi:hypothetical protein PIB30_067353 [Stylosanthes scabra]|uniref:Zinc finger GRF-type domain-containing protein n=1 Tax=Stylosanthes scabra TaxID=79078 RepID=A0ABU6QPL9_9FABA|nr:hypothetical protein [Stylosanthes scabra]